jgi:hypothetical protein
MYVSYIKFEECTRDGIDCYSSFTDLQFAHIHGQLITNPYCGQSNIWSLKCFVSILWCGSLSSSLMFLNMNAGFVILRLLGRLASLERPSNFQERDVLYPSCNDFMTLERAASHKRSGFSWPDVDLQHHSLKSRTCKEWGYIPCW